MASSPKRIILVASTIQERVAAMGIVEGATHIGIERESTDGVVSRRHLRCQKGANAPTAVLGTAGGVAHKRSGANGHVSGRRECCW